MTPSPQYAVGALDERTDTFEMSLEEARAILDGSAPPLVTTGDAVPAPVVCGGCGVMVGHGPTHERHHGALLVLAAYLDAALGDDEDDEDTAPSNEPRIGASGLPV